MSPSDTERATRVTPSGDDSGGRGARSPDRCRVIVVGAGLAGLTAAFRLQQAGAAVTVLEARSSVAANVAPIAIEEFTLSEGGRAIPTSAPRLRGLAMELGLGLEVRRTPLERALLRSPSAEDGWGHVAIRGAPIGRGIGTAIRRRRALRLMRWYGAFLDPERPAAGLRLDDRSIADWSDLYLGPDEVDRRLSPLFQNHFGLDVRETSRLTALLMLDPFGRPDICAVSGIAKLATTLAKGLEDVRTDTRVVQTLPGGRGVTLASGEVLHADVTVLAVPGDAIRGLVPDLTPAEDVMAGTFVTDDWAALVVVTKGAPAAYAPPTWVRGSRRITGALALPAPADRPDGDTQARAFLLDTRGGAGALDPDAILHEATFLFPDLERHTTAVRLVVREKSVPRFAVGHHRAVDRITREAEKLGPRRNLVYAGRYLYGPHAEAAILSGEHAAARCLAGLATERA